MELAIGEIDIKAEGAASIPGRGNSVRTASGLQRPRIGGAGSPGVVELILNGQGSIAGDGLRVVGHGISIGSVDAMPTALRGGIGRDEAGGCFRTAAAAASKEDATDDGVAATGPVDIDSDVAGEIPDQINTVAETGECARVQHRTGVGV